MNTSTFAASGTNTFDRALTSSLGSWLVAFSYVLFCISDTLLTFEDDRSQIVKLAAFGMVALAIMVRPRFHRLLLLVLPMTICLLVALTRSFNIDAGREELLRFLAPMALTMALFAYRDRLGPIVIAFFAIVVSNDLFQCYFYIAYILKLPLLLPVRIDSGLYLRAQGWMGFFSEFSFNNFCAFLLCRHCYPTKRSRVASWIFLAFSLCGFSFKIFATLGAYAVVTRRVNARSLLQVGACIGAALVLVASGVLDTALKLATVKLSAYVFAGNSARAESYRVMYESLMKGNVWGEGLGNFGGPASIKHYSPLYSEYHFNWYSFGYALKTTDTFYPHLFVELGVLGACIWLAFMLFYGQRRRQRAPWIFVVVAFCFDNVFTLSFVSASYVFAALLTMYLFSDIKSVSRWSRPAKAALNGSQAQ